MNLIHAKEAKKQYKMYLNEQNEVELAKMLEKIKILIVQESKTKPSAIFECDEKFHKALKLWLEEYGYTVECEKEYFRDPREYMDNSRSAYIKIIWG